jgi:PAS domain S-box-containing protein
MRADGAVRWVAPYGRILLDAEGQACRFVGVFRDITEQKQAQEALRMSEERLRLAQSNTGVGIFDWDLQTQALYWSPELEALDGLPPGSMQCIENFRRRVHPEDLAAADSSRDAAIQGHQQSYEEFRIIRPDGEERWVLAMAKAIYDAAGHPLRVVGTNLDITERKRFELALQVADRQKNEFLAMLAHELRNPLAPIQNAAEVLSHRGPNDPMFQRPLEIIRRQVEHMSRLVDDLLDTSRLISDKITLRKKPLQLAQIVDEALEVCQSALENRKHKLSTRLSGDIFIDADKARLVQVVTNLLSNAIKFTPPGRLHLG